MKIIKSNQSNTGLVTTTSIGRTLDFQRRTTPDRYVCACISEK